MTASEPPTSPGERRPKVLHVTTVDMSLDLLLLPQLQAFAAAGFDVVGASAPGPYVAHLEAARQSFAQRRDIAVERLRPEPGRGRTFCRGRYHLRIELLGPVQLFGMNRIMMVAEQQTRVEAALNQMEEGGATITRLSDEERAKWADALPQIANVWAENADGQGLAGSEVLDAYIGLLKEAGVDLPRDWTQR